MLKYSPLLCALILGCSSESTDATTTTDSGTTGAADSDTVATTDGGTTTTDAATGTDASTAIDASTTADAAVSNRVPWTPPTGIKADANPDSPGPRRILLATSTDGLTFTRKSKVLSDQANTPNMIVTASGEVRIYYTSSSVDGSKDGIIVATSTDNGSTWSYYKPTMNGFAANHPPIGDPDVVETAPGKYVMYITNGITATKAGIHRTVSSDDGFTFDYDRIAFTPTVAYSQVDSLTRKIGSTYTMLIIDPPTGKMNRLTSADGLTFTEQGLVTFSHSGKVDIISNWFDLGGGNLRVYSFSLDTNSINSFSTTDGITYTAEAGDRLKFATDPLEKTWVKDAAVAKLKDGTYLMAYVSETP